MGDVKERKKRLSNRWSRPFSRRRGPKKELFERFSGLRVGASHARDSFPPHKEEGGGEEGDPEKGLILKLFKTN